MPRFVVLRHETPPGYRQGLHWDLMLQEEDHLLTWSLEQPPRPDVEIQATELPPHRLHYLDYEGPVSDNRGHVTRWDTGDFEWIRRDVQECVAVLHGREKWRVVLSRMHDQSWVARFTAPEG